MSFVGVFSPKICSEDCQGTEKFPAAALKAKVFRSTPKETGLYSILWPNST